MRKLHLHSILNVLLLVLICVVLAKIAADMISYRLSRAVPAQGRKSAPPSPLPSNEPLASYAPILEKGLFGKAARGKLVPVETAAAPGKPADTPGDIVLLGTSTGSFRETFALLQKASTREERVFRLGEKVFDLGRLDAVRKDSVEILAGGKRVRILTPHAAPVAGGKEKAASGAYQIDQRVLNAALDDMGRAMTDARLLPSMKNGKVDGFRVSEVKPAGIFAMVGIRDGDILMRINDFSIDSPEKAFQTLASLKGQSRIKLDLTRNGQPTTLTYDIK